MTNPGAVLQTVIVPILLVVLAGYFIQRITRIDTTTLSEVVLHVLAPCLVFTSITGAVMVGREWLEVCSLAIVATLALIAASWSIAKIANLSNETSAAFVLSTSFMNAGNLGLPVTMLAFGLRGLELAAIFFVTNMFLMFTVGVIIASRGKHGLRQALINIVRLPLIYAIVAGTAMKMSHTDTPGPIMQAVSLIAQAAVPGMLILLGMELSRSGLQKIRDFRWIALSSAVKLLMPYLIVGLVSALVGIAGLAEKTAILEASMPTAVFVSLITLKFGGDSRFANNVIVSPHWLVSRR